MPDSLHLIDLGEWLAEELARTGWSKARLSKASGVSRPAIDGVLRGERDTDRKTVGKLAGALGLDPPELRQAVRKPGASPDGRTVRGAIHLARAYLEVAEGVLEREKRGAKVGRAVAGAAQLVDVGKKRKRRQDEVEGGEAAEGE